jgi:coenzyme F420-dependent glucose-6-phosphate dehydrogenase
MLKLGFTLSSEEHKPQKLINTARLAEEASFDFISISDHFSPWTNKQGESSYVWTVLGGISQVTSKVTVMVGVTCPIIRYSPAILAQAAATVSSLMEGRFWFGVGTGELLNEHIEIAHWPHIDTRLDMLQEAIQIIRELWTGEYVDITGVYFSYEKARIYTLPNELPKIIVAAAGEKSAKMAGKLGDGLVSTKEDPTVIQAFQSEIGDTGKPKICQIDVCWATTKEEAKDTAFAYWPISGLKGPLSTELRLPEYFEEATQGLTPDEATQTTALGPDPEDHIKLINKYRDLGYDHIYVHQIGPAQEEAIKFYQNEILPSFRD